MREIHMLTLSHAGIQAIYCAYICIMKFMYIMTCISPQTQQEIVKVNLFSLSAHYFFESLRDFDFDLFIIKITAYSVDVIVPKATCSDLLPLVLELIRTKFVLNNISQ